MKRAGLALLLIVSFPVAQADIPLPLGSIAGCPFIHEDAYDLGPTLDSLQTQLKAKLDGHATCLQATQTIYSNLTALQNFYQNIDPAMKQKLSKGVYSSLIQSLQNRIDFLNSTGQASSTEASNDQALLLSIQSSDIQNSIDLQYNQAAASTSIEANFRTQLANYTSSLLNAYTATARTNPECINVMGGWNQALSAVMGGMSIVTGLGVGAGPQLIGEGSAIVSQFVNLLTDSHVRLGYNELIRAKNRKTLECTFYALQKTACEYKRAYGVSLEIDHIRDFNRNRYDPSIKGEYDRFFVNQGRIDKLAKILSSIAQMGSALTLDQSLLSNYMQAKSVDFLRLPPHPPIPVPPIDDSQASEIQTWLIKARGLGVSYSEYNNNGPTTLIERLNSAIADIEKKKSISSAVDKLLRENQAFLDTRRHISGTFPNAIKNLLEMKSYLAQMHASPLISDVDRPTLGAAETLLNKLNLFLEIKEPDNKAGKTDYEAAVIKAGGELFDELAHGAVAQLTTSQSAFALADKGRDRLSWAFNVIQNSYLDRDLTQNLPLKQRFSEYSKTYYSLSDVTANYSAFAGAGAVNRSDDYAIALKAFTHGFKQEIFRSLDTSYADQNGMSELRGLTKAHLCALYAPALKLISSSRSTRILEDCEANYQTLQLNHLIPPADAKSTASTHDFKIDYEDVCTYINYSRELEIQNLIAPLLN